MENRSRNSKALEQLDVALNAAFMAADKNGVCPINALMLCASNAAEYGCWHSNGDAQQVASTMLRGVARHFKKYEPPKGSSVPDLAMEVRIDCQVMAGANDNLEARMLLTAFAQYIECRMITNAGEATHDFDFTKH